MSTINLSDLDKKAEQVQTGRKNLSAKKGLNSFFTPQSTIQPSPQAPPDDISKSSGSGEKIPKHKVEISEDKPSQESKTNSSLNEIEKLKSELEKERKKFETEKYLLIKERESFKSREKETDEIIHPKSTHISSPEINGHKIEFQSLFLVTTLFRDFSTPEVKFLRCIIELTDYGKSMDVHIGYDEIKEYGLQSGQLKSLRDRFLSLGIISCRKGRKSQKSKSVEFYTLNSFKYPSY